MLDVTTKVRQKERKDEEKINDNKNNNKQANININNETTSTTTVKTNNEITMSNNYTTIFSNYNSNNSAAIDNINVIYDNDTTVVELPTNDNYEGLNSNTVSFGKHKSSSKMMNDFINSDRTEEVERENYATCLFEPLGNSKQVSSQVGRLNFWQPINNRGALHVLVRFRYIEHNLNGANLSEPAHSVKRRESFRAPVEQIPDGINNSLQINNSIKKKKHQIWLTNECKTIHHDRQLLIEVNPTVESSQPNNESKVIDFDAELTIAHVNLSGANSIINKHLIIELPDHLNNKQVGREFACCKVKQVETFPITELDNLASISVVQPIREDLLITTSTITPIVSKKTEV